MSSGGAKKPTSKQNAEDKTSASAGASKKDDHVTNEKRDSLKGEKMYSNLMLKQCFL